MSHADWLLWMMWMIVPSEAYWLQCTWSPLIWAIWCAYFLKYLDPMILRSQGIITHGPLDQIQRIWSFDGPWEVQADSPPRIGLHVQGPCIVSISDLSISACTPWFHFLFYLCFFISFIFFFNWFLLVLIADFYFHFYF